MAIGRVQNGDTVDSVWLGDEMAELRKSISNNELHRVCAGAGCSFIRSAIPSEKDLQRLERYGKINIDVPEATQVFARMGRPSSMGEVGRAYHDKAREQLRNKSPWFALELARAIFWYRRGHRGGDGVSSQALAEVLVRMFFDARQKPWTKKLGRLLQVRWIAKHYALTAAELGYTQSQFLIGRLLAEDLSKKQLYDINSSSRAAAVGWLRKAGDGGDLGGYYLAGQLLMGHADSTEEGQHLIDLAIRRGFVADTPA